MGLTWIQLNAITGIGMNMATTQPLVLRTRTELEALEAVFLVPVPKEVKL